MRKAKRLGLLGALLCAAASPLGASGDKAGDQTRIVLENIQARDAVFQNIGWRLLRANANYCDNAHLQIGLQLQDAASFARPASVRSALELEGDFAVQTAAKGSPAFIANIAANREITAIDGADINGWAAKQKLEWRRLKRAHDAIDTSLESNGYVIIHFAGGSAETLMGVRACPTRFELLGKGKKALADGSRVQFGAEFPAFDYPEDELAAVIAHELAHNLLRHRKWLDANGRKRRNIRATEREADRLMPWLIANAGYDPNAATRFMERWGPAHSKGLFRARTHDGWDERAEMIAQEVVTVKGRIAETGAADWSKYFRRGIKPLAGED